ncbi:MULTISPECIES: TMEM175 family protein [unclassified Variovorax]|uniref:TMEM175 family protein n=1 Tax=unclassified Variovorax TaxID=663243 RepID=UPI002B22DBBC|nr:MULTISPECIES: TMEM175 family protein [unclassified Variovorax]MEB0059964.1 TMEM175 family protein [Variovorax sp. LG9.2]MEB0113828.1 TMEM175 family protein [Variovorax sp. RTB1]
MYPKNRLEALTDGIFAVAMTLLVLDLRIPDEIGSPTDEASLVHALLALTPKLIPYLLSFYLLGVSWLSLIKVRSRSEVVGAGYARWCLLYLLFVTLLPFSTVVMGRFTAYAAATALYAANIGLVAATGFLLMSVLPDPVRDAHWLDRRVSLVVLFASCVLTIVLSFITPGNALWALALNLAAGPTARVYALFARAA